MTILSSLEILQLNSDKAADPCIKAVPEQSLQERMYLCSDGRWVALAYQDVLQIQPLLETGDSKPELVLSQWASERTAYEVVENFYALGLGAAKVHYGSEMNNHPEIQRQGVFCKRPDGTLVNGFPFQFTESTRTIWGDAPKVGEHSDRFISED